MKLVAVTRKIFIETRHHCNAIYLIVTDPMSGRRGRYTVHMLSLVGFKSARVIGRELPLGHARRIVAERCA